MSARYLPARSVAGRSAVVALVLLLAIGLLPTASIAQPPTGAAGDGAVPELDLTGARRTEPEGEAVHATGSREPRADEAFIDGHSATGLWFVQLDEPPVATYDGGTAGFTTTQPDSEDGERLDAEAGPARAYEGYLLSEQATVQRDLAAEIGRTPRLASSYTRSFNGFAVELTEAEARVASTMPGVLRVQPDQLRHTTSDAGPEFIRAIERTVDGTVIPTAAIGTLGEGMVVGIIDGGISPINPSFADLGETDPDAYDFPEPVDGYVGVCDPDVDDPSGITTWDRSFPCNDKLIGAWNYVADSRLGARDDDGHGSHVASIAVGNPITVEVTASNGATTGLVQISGVAPNAHVISYRTCDIGTCSTAAVVAAIDQAILDGVDVLNLSLGSSAPGNPWTDPISVAFLNARSAGISVVAANGNTGPAAGSVGDAGVPWATSVAASQHNRLYQQTIVAGDESYVGKGFSTGLPDAAPILYAGDFGNRLCKEGQFDADADDAFDGAIVICDRGELPIVEKSSVVAALGAVGFVVVSEATDGPQLHSLPYTVPGVHLTHGDGEALKAALASRPDLTGTITATAAVFDDAFGAVQAEFSARGPHATTDYLNPDVTAPGVDIIAALGDASTNDPARGETAVYGPLSGTSQASPHVAGATALLRAAHPQWSPSAIQSALMTTARTEGLLKEDEETPADPYDYGAGYVDVSAAARAGLVLEESEADYLAADPATGGDTASVNAASLSNRRCRPSCSWTRTVTITDAGAGAEWTTTATAEPGVDVTVVPATFTGPAGAQIELTITADPSDATVGEVHFGQVVMSPSVGSVPTAHMNMAVVWPADMILDHVRVGVQRDAGSHAFGPFVSDEVTGFSAEVGGLTKGVVTELSLPLDGVHTTTLTVPDGATRLVAEIVESASPDVDLHIGVGDTPSGDTSICSADSAGIAEEVCDILDPTPGTYWVVVESLMASAEGAVDAVTLATAAVGPDSGSLEVTGPATQRAGAPYDVVATWDVPAWEEGDRWYGTANLSSGSAPGDLGTVRLDLERLADDVTTTADVNTAKPGDTLTYTIDVAPNSTTTDVTYTITDTLPDGVTYVEGSLSDPAATEADGVITWAPTLVAFRFTGASLTYRVTVDPGTVGDLVNLVRHDNDVAGTIVETTSDTVTVTADPARPGSTSGDGGGGPARPGRPNPLITGGTASPSGAPLTVIVVDGDAAAAGVRIVSVTQPGQGQVTVDAAGTGLVFTPDPATCTPSDPVEVTATLSDGSTTAVQIAVDCSTALLVTPGGQILDGRLTDLEVIDVMTDVLIPLGLAAEGATSPQEALSPADLSVLLSMLTELLGTSDTPFAQVPPVSGVLLASDTVFADALASGTLQTGGTRLLLTDPDQLSPAVADEIDRLGVDSVTILGGDAAVAPAVADALIAAGLEVERLAGPTRIETAIAIAGRVVDTNRVFLVRAFPDATALDPTQPFADSLAAGGWAAATGAALLFTQSEVLTGATADALAAADLQRLTAIGGRAAIHDAVVDAIAAPTVDRTAGDTRFDTAVHIARARTATPDSAIIIEGQAETAWVAGFALAGLSGELDAPILLTTGDSIPDVTADYLAQLTPTHPVICMAATTACQTAAALLDSR